MYGGDPQVLRYALAITYVAGIEACEAANGDSATTSLPTPSCARCGFLATSSVKERRDKSDGGLV
jgi:hypothetical protein